MNKVGTDQSRNWLLIQQLLIPSQVAQNGLKLHWPFLLKSFFTAQEKVSRLLSSLINVCGYRSRWILAALNV
jgi:hypothetical protein